MVVTVDAVIAPPTWPVPLMTASLKGTPSSLIRVMFSSTTIASSTSLPAPSASPPSVIMLRVKWPKYIRLNVAIIEIGIATLITSVVPIRLRKTYRIKTARKIPINNVFFTSPIALWI